MEKKIISKEEHMVFEIVSKHSYWPDAVDISSIAEEFYKKIILTSKNLDERTMVCLLTDLLEKVCKACER